MYVLILHYKKPLAEIDAHLEAHRAYLSGFYAQDKLLASGPQIPRNGGIVLGEFDSEDELKSFINNDPFTKAGVGEYQAIQFDPVKRSSRIQLKQN